MTDQRVGRHVRIYEWDEVDIEDATPATAPEQTPAKAASADAKSKPEAPKTLGGLLRRKLF